MEDYLFDNLSFTLVDSTVARFLTDERWVPLVSDGFSLWLQIGDFSVYLGNQDYLGFSSDYAIDDTIGR